jgi:CRP-like cAMP-binding protein
VDLEELRADWHRATEKDKPHDAVKALVELEKLDPNEPRWSQRLGESYRRIGQTKEAVDAFARAFDRYFSRGFLPRAIAMAKLVRTLDAARGDLLEKSLPESGPGVPPPLSFGGLQLTRKKDAFAPPLHLAPAPEPAAHEDRGAAAPPKAVVKPPPLPTGDGPKPARRPPPPPPPPGPAVSAPPPLPTPAAPTDSRGLKVVKPAPLSRAEDSSIDEIRFDDAPASSIEILLVEFMGSDVVTLEVEDAEEDIDDDDAPPTRPVERAPVSRGSSQNAYASLAAVRLFAALSRDALVALSDASELVEYVPSAMIIVRDERAFALYTIVSGSVRVIVHGSAEIRLGEGDVFGEASLLEEGKRQADVRADSDLMTLRIEKSRLDALTKQYPELRDALFDLLARRLITNLMHTSPLFNSFEPQIRLELAQKFEVRRAEPGTVIAERGRRSDGLYVLLAGDVMAEPANGPATRIARGTAFGHASLLGSGSSDVTVKAATEAVLLRMPAMGFASLAAHFPPALAHLAETAHEPLPESSREA